MTDQRSYFVYILSSKRNGTLYIGVTNDLVRRAFEHKHKLVDGFTQRYGVSMLVYYEVHHEIQTAIHREKQLKKWNRSWKLRLIEKHNPDWMDLYRDGVIAPLKTIQADAGCPLAACGHDRGRLSFPKALIGNLE